MFFMKNKIKIQVKSVTISVFIRCYEIFNKNSVIFFKLTYKINIFLK